MTSNNSIHATQINKHIIYKHLIQLTIDLFTIRQQNPSMHHIPKHFVFTMIEQIPEINQPFLEWIALDPIDESFDDATNQFIDEIVDEFEKYLEELNQQTIHADNDSKEISKYRKELYKDKQVTQIDHKLWSNKHQTYELLGEFMKAQQLHLIHQLDLNENAHNAYNETKEIIKQFRST